MVTNDDLDEALALHAQEERAAYQHMLTDLITRAFPDGPENHRGYHQAKIDTAREEAEFWKVAKQELTKVGVSAIAGVVKTLAVLALIGLAYKIGFGPVVAKLFGGGL